MNDAQAGAGLMADAMIAREVEVQDRMWGDANERADATGNQLLNAAIAQAVLTVAKLEGEPIEVALEAGQCFYPPDWNGFRDYGSTAANLVVAAAFLRSEIKRRILLGEDLTRSRRGEAYKGPDMPYTTSDEVIMDLSGDIAVK